MLISVVTPTIGRPSLETRCAPSVVAQTWRAVEHLIERDDPPAGDWGVSARLRALGRARGDLVAYLDDDNAYRPEHLKVLADAWNDLAVDFVYGRMQRYDRQGAPLDVRGEAPPCLGQIDTSLILHSRELLDVETWRPAGYAADWDLVERWLNAGATYAFVPQITVDYYVSR